MSKKHPVRFVVTREYSGDVGMEKVFENVLETVIFKKYELWVEKKRVESRREAC